MDRELPLVAGVYSRPGGRFYAGDALDNARAKYGTLSTFLWQKSLYAGSRSPDPSLNSPGHDVETLFDNAEVREGRVVPQISVDAVDPVEWQRTRVRDLAELKDKMCAPGSEEAQAMRRWARFLKSKGTLVQFRPFSEMNNPLDGHLRYHLLSRNASRGNSRAEHLAGMWTCMRGIFREERADNVKFTINVTGTLCRNPDSATENQDGNREWMRALRMIPPRDVDAIGIHPYCRFPEPRSSSSAEDMITPWLREIDQTAHRGKPIVISEMGISRGYPDAERARWICQAYQFARSHKHRIRGMVYFDHKTPAKDWSIDPRETPKAFNALREALGLGLDGAPLADDYCQRTYR